MIIKVGVCDVLQIFKCGISWSYTRFIYSVVHLSGVSYNGLSKTVRNNYGTGDTKHAFQSLLVRGEEAFVSGDFQNW